MYNNNGSPVVCGIRKWGLDIFFLAKKMCVIILDPNKNPHNSLEDV